jgi:hypothetical protein
MITIQTMPTTPIREIKGKIEFYKDSILLHTASHNDNLQTFEVSRTAQENKLFGFIVMQKIIIKILDKDAELNIEKGNRVKAFFNHGEGYISPFPSFYITDIKRDIVKKEVTITAYDGLYNSHTVNEIPIAYDNYETFIDGSIGLLRVGDYKLINCENLIMPYYEQGANFNGTESIQTALTALAEAAQAIIYISNDDEVILKRLDSAIVSNFTKSDYFTFSNKNRVAVSELAHITELGNNIEATRDFNGVACYMRNNPFLELIDESITAQIVEAGLTHLTNLIQIPFELKARGNYLLEIGDCFTVETENGNVTQCYLINDLIKYNGGLSQKIYWNHTETAKESATNPTTIGEAIKQTTAKVDKINREIELLVSESDIANSKLTALELSTDHITATVENIEKAASETTNELTELTKRVEATMSAEQVKLEIKTELANGAAKVETATGYTFDENGLTVSKSGSEMTTAITEDGMTVYKDGNAVLVADNEGVTAIDLRARTYLIIGENSRLEDFGARTACFWIGGNS